jgi:APA family basic amino acid/polyamine antiporter
MTVINLLGINRTAFGSKVLALITIFFLLFLIGSSLALPNAEIALEAGSILGVLSAAALVFFAFAGYARVATLGGELKNPTTDVPRAVWISFAIVLVLYLALSSVLMVKLGKGMGESIVPVAQLATLNWGSPNLTGVFVAIAGLGSLLALLAGMSRTASEMAVDGELPAAFAKKLKNGAPHIAELSLAVLVLALSLGGGIFVSLGVSSFCVLVYYAIVNLAAFRQPKTESERPKFLSILGLLACLLLAFSVPLAGLIQGSILLLMALFLRWGLRLIR